MKRALLVLALLGCNKERDWDVPHSVAFGRMAAARLTLCVQNNPCVHLPQCFMESAAHCLDAGYARECGQMEQESSCGVGVK